MLHHSSSCLVILPGRQLLLVIVTSSLVPMPIVWLPTPTDTEVLAKLILPFLETDQLLPTDWLDDDPQVYLSWMGEWIPRGQMEERYAGKLPQHGCSLGLHDLSRGTVLYVGSGRFEGSCPLVIAQG